MWDRSNGERDYYRLFGLSPDATTEQIVEAYRRLARRFHPDVAAEASGSSEMFKRITEAYGVLTDPHRRRDYDGRRSRRGERSRSRDEGAVPASDDPSTVRRARSAFPHRIAGDIESELVISPEEAHDGGSLDLTITIPTTCHRCGGQGRIAGAICGDCEGLGKFRDQRRLRIALPRGAGEGLVLRLPSQGRRVPGGAGDLVLRITIRPCG
jgi:molecular chaperone DnaJ